MTISSCCTLLYAAFPGLLSANQLAWLTLTDICVLLSPQDSPEHPGAGRAGGSDPPQPGPQPGNAATRKVTPPGLLGAGNSTGVLLFEKTIKAGGREDHPHGSPGHSRGKALEHGCKPTHPLLGETWSSSCGAAGTVRGPQGSHVGTRCPPGSPVRAPSPALPASAREAGWDPFPFPAPSPRQGAWPLTELIEPVS